MWQRIRRSGIAPWLWLTSLALLFIAVTQNSIGLLLRNKAPETALRLAPDSAGALASAAAATVRSQTASAAARARASRLAKAALAREPGNVSATATLGLVAALEGRQNEARAFFNYSALRSRRDLQTQLWLIEDAVARQSIPKALTHYDIALRTKKSASEILFPILTAATSDSEIRDAIVAIFKMNPPWREAFEGYLVTHIKDLSAAAALFASMARSGTPASLSSENALLSNMVTAGEIDDAWRYYRLRHSRSDPIQLRNATFSPKQSDGSPFDWALVNDNGISTALGSDASGGALSFEVSPSVAGTVAQQLQRLPPGRFRLTGHSRALGEEASKYVFWEVSCIDGRPLARVKVLPSEDSPAGFATSFEVPAANCAFQQLRLTVLPSDNIEGISGEMLDIRFDRIGPA